MVYYSIAPLGTAGKDAYTYSSKEPIKQRQVVKIPFAGGTRLGIVMNQDKPRKSRNILDASPLTIPKQSFDLARWTADEYVAPLGLALKQLLGPEILKYQTIEQPPIAAHPTSQPKPPELLLAAHRLDSYQKAIRDTLGQGQAVLLITPEIAMARSTLRQAKPFSQGIVYHSRLTPKQKAAVWWRVYSGEPVLIIGSRSSLWLPWTNLGQVIIDEEDDPSYKEDHSPTYHARPVSAKLAALHGADLIYGSVAPSMETYRLAIEGKVRVGPGYKADGKIVMVNPDRNPGHRGLISFELWSQLKETVQSSGRALLYAPQRFQPVLSAELSQSFPKKTITVLDSKDLVAKNNPAAGQILVGGHSLIHQHDWQPTLIGCLGLDQQLQIPDFRTTEKVHGLLRRLLAQLTAAGSLLIQTTTPDHPVFLFLKKPYAKFAEIELKERQTLSLPPYSRLSRVTWPAEADSRRRAQKFVDQCQAEGLSASIRAGRSESWVVLVKGSPKKLRSLLPRDMPIDVDPA